MNQKRIDYPEIGSDFWQIDVGDYNNSSLWWEDSLYNRVFFKSGRNAIKGLCDEINLKNKLVWLPNYICETVINSFLQAGACVDYYSVTSRFEIDQFEFNAKLKEKEPDVVVVQNYFGFNTLVSSYDVLHKIKEMGIYIVQDITHDIFNCYNLSFADYYFASLRKFLAIPDGGVLISKKKMEKMIIVQSDNVINNVAKQAFELKEKYMDNPTTKLKENFLQLFSKLKNLIAENSELVDMSQESKKIFWGCNHRLIIEKRRKNYLNL